MQKSGLAGAGFPHQRQHFTALDIQRKAGENHQVGVAGAVDFREIASANEGLRHPTATITQVGGGGTRKALLSWRSSSRFPTALCCNLRSFVEPGGSRQLQFCLQRYNDPARTGERETGN